MRASEQESKSRVPAFCGRVGLPNATCPYFFRNDAQGNKYTIDHSALAFACRRSDVPGLSAGLPAQESLGAGVPSPVEAAGITGATGRRYCPVFQRLSETFAFAQINFGRLRFASVCVPTN